MDPAAVTELDVSAGFPWSNQADRDELLDYVDKSGAEQIVLTHRHADTLAETLRANRPGVQSLGPPRQMNLF